jgi:hypothetical protein
MTAIVFGQHIVCRRCDGKGVFATVEDRRHRSAEMARIGRIERRTGEPMDRPPFKKSDCAACGGTGYVQA